MSWIEELAGLSRAVDGEFGRVVRHVPMRRVPNGRPEPDPARPAYDTRAILDFPSAAALTDRRRTIPKETSIPIDRPFASFDRRDLTWVPDQADEIVAPDLDARFRVLSHEREMSGRMRVWLEHVGSATGFE